MGAAGHRRGSSRVIIMRCIPHVIGAVTVAGLAPGGVLFGFGAFLIATGLFYGLPLPVQPMKAISAVILTDGLKSGEA
jgi:hypothetical protein